jgi:hypothetical protein
LDLFALVVGNSFGGMDFLDLENASCSDHFASQKVETSSTVFILTEIKGTAETFVPPEKASSWARQTTHSSEVGLFG